MDKQPMCIMCVTQVNTHPQHTQNVSANCTAALIVREHVSTCNGPMTQPNPYPTQPPYIEQQLACRKKISLCTSCHHYHPNAHRNNANTHSITSITVILGLHATPNEYFRQMMQ